jgi:hypothetical protein
VLAGETLAMSVRRGQCRIGHHSSSGA